MNYVHVPCWAAIAVPSAVVVIDVIFPKPIDYLIYIGLYVIVLVYLFWKKRAPHPSVIDVRARRSVMSHIERDISAARQADAAALQSPADAGE